MLWNPIPHDKDVLKAFIYISEYFINNQPNYAQIIRQNRISAYPLFEARK